MTDVTLTIRRLGALDGRSPEQVRPTGHNAWGQLPTATLQARLTAASFRRFNESAQSDEQLLAHGL
jgi:hypothetical protein